MSESSGSLGQGLRNELSSFVKRQSLTVRGKTSLSFDA